ncbi:hypothetical protein PENTCL1PPCAC_19047, partial [Pristionchus entomophagus]
MTLKCSTHLSKPSWTAEDSRICRGPAIGDTILEERGLMIDDLKCTTTKCSVIQQWFERGATEKRKKDLFVDETLVYKAKYNRGRMSNKDQQ